MSGIGMESNDNNIEEEPNLEMEIEHYGRLTYYQKANCFVAFCNCAKHKTTLDKKGKPRPCRLTRTLNRSDAVPGRGYPIGKLIAWLLIQDTYPDQKSHVHDGQKESRLKYSTRCDARAYFKTRTDWRTKVFLRIEGGDEKNPVLEPKKAP